MDKSNLFSSELLVPYAAVLALIAAAIFGGTRMAPTPRPASGEVAPDTQASLAQAIPARLWQDPFEVTEKLRKSPPAPPKDSESFKAPLFEELIKERAHVDAIKSPDGTWDYTNLHRVLYLFVPLPSDPYPEASEQRIRTRVALISALSTAGYRAESGSRLGIVSWDAADEENRTLTPQRVYPYEVFVYDGIRRVLQPGKLKLKADDIIVVYVEEDALPGDRQLAWLKSISKLVAANVPTERWKFTYLRFLGPTSSDRLGALLQMDNADRSKAAKLVASSTPPGVPAPPPFPIRVLSVRPTISPDLLQKIVDGGSSQESTESPKNEATARSAAAPSTPPWWLTISRLGCQDDQMVKALVEELRRRRPQLFKEPEKAAGSSGTPAGITSVATSTLTGTPIATPPAAGATAASTPAAATSGEKPSVKGKVVLISEWDTLYGRALPKSFVDAFAAAGGLESPQRFTYLRGLDGQTSGSVAEKTKADAKKANPVEATDLLQQLMQSSAPSIAYGRTQVDYVDRLAAQLRTFDRAQAGGKIQAIGILGSDTYDKLLILQSLRKTFPGALYFTTELDAVLFAPEQYDITRNLLVASGFDLRLRDEYQGTILPFRDSGQAAIYFATLHAVEFFTLGKGINVSPTPADHWTPAVYEIGRSGPYLLRSASELEAASPFPRSLESAYQAQRRWLSPFIALVIVVCAALTQYGTLALKQMAGWVAACRRRRNWNRILTCLWRDPGTWLVVLGGALFLVAAYKIPEIAQRPGEEPFHITEGISSWPATWMRAGVVFGCACYFWVIVRQFRRALAGAQREFLAAATPSQRKPKCPKPAWKCEAWDDFCQRSRGWPFKVLVPVSVLIYMLGVRTLFVRDVPALTTRGEVSMAWEFRILMAAVMTMNLLIAYAVIHNLSCAAFIRRVAVWLRNPDVDAIEDDRPLHTAVIRAIAHIAGAMTQMIYYPFILIFLMLAARQPLFDNFDWPMPLIVVFAVSSSLLLASTMLLRRSADQARKNAVAWLEENIDEMQWEASLGGKKPVKKGEALQARAKWQLEQIKEVGGAALTQGWFGNPLLRAILIPLGGTGLLQGMEFLSKVF